MQRGGFYLTFNSNPRQFNAFTVVNKGENEMLRNLSILIVAWSLVGVSQACAIEIADAVVTTAVVDRQPMDVVEVFPRQNGTLFCFTRVVGAEGDTVVYHLWYYGEELMSRVELPVRSTSWRTWSAKELLEEWPGQWRIEIQDAEGHLLTELTFELR